MDQGGRSKKLLTVGVAEDVEEKAAHRFAVSVSGEHSKCSDCILLLLLTGSWTGFSNLCTNSCK